MCQAQQIMPSRKTTKKSPQLRQIEARLKIVREEIARRKKNKKHSINNRKKSPIHECHRILKYLKNLKFASEFLEPFDWEKAECHNYLDFVPTPMDFDTVTRKLENQEYATMYDFGYDIHLILANAMCYNFQSRDRIYKDSVRLHNKFTEEFLKSVQQCEPNEFTVKLVRILCRLFKLDHSVIFKYPVPYEAMQLRGYRDVVSKPMDLGTIFKRIHKYNDFRAFLNDVNLTFDNCMKFNPPTNLYFGWGDELKDWAKKYARTEFPQVCDVFALFRLLMYFYNSNFFL